MLIEFITEFEKLKAIYPSLYVSISGKDFWRIKVFAQDMAVIGDAELLTAESNDREKAFEIALRKIKEIPGNIIALLDIKSQEREIYRRKRG